MPTSTDPVLGVLPLRRRCAYVAITAVWFLAVGLLLAELFLQLRWVPPSSLSHRAFGPHPVYATGPLPGAAGRHVKDEYDVGFEINRLGFRGPLPDLSTPAERPRILVLGDSQTFGLGCNEGETFCDRLRSELTDVDVLNAGSNGYGTREELAVLDRLGEAWRPDLILLVFFWNDLEDNVKRQVPSFGRDAAGRVVRTDPFDASFDPLALREPVEAQLRGVRGLRLPLYLKEGLRGIRYRTLGIKPRMIQTTEQRDAALQVTRDLLELAELRARELGARLVVACLPSQTQVDPTAVIRHIEPLNYDIQQPLFAVCDELGIPTVDLLPPLAAEFQRNGEALYFFADRHLMPRGHAIVGAALAQACRAQLLEASTER